MDKPSKNEVHDWLYRQREHGKPLQSLEEYRREQEGSDVIYRREVGWNMIKDNQQHGEKR